MSRTRDTKEKETKGTVKKRRNVKLVARGNNYHRSLADPNMLKARRKKKQEESIGFLLFDLNQRYIILYAVAYFLFLLCLCFMIYDTTTVQTNIGGSLGLAFLPRVVHVVDVNDRVADERYVL